MTDKAKNILMVFVPVIVYFAVAETAAILLHYIRESGWINIDGTVSQMIQTLVALPFVILFFYRPERSRYKKWHESQLSGKYPGKIRIEDAVVALLLMIAGSYALNNFAELINISDISQSYGEIEQSFYSGGFIAELTAFAIVSPIAEEILYRGVVFLYIKRTLGVWPAVIISSIVFAVFHMNLVQFIYALFLGFYLGIIMEHSENLLIPAIGHAAANALSVIRAETYFLSVERLGFNMYVGSAVAAFVISLVLAVYICIKLGKRLNIVEKK